MKDKLKEIRDILKTGDEHFQVVDSWVIVNLMEALIRDEDYTFYDNLGALVPMESPENIRCGLEKEIEGLEEELKHLRITYDCM